MLKRLFVFHSKELFFDNFFVAVNSGVAQFFFDTKQLVVFSHTVRTA